ncbi:MAG: hypothetical protein U0791_26755 [Gemmataceae bacterium]
MLRLTIVGILVLALTAIAQPGKPPYQVPEPKGWSTESIALPPKDFAPEMKWKGQEEIRFAPGMFKADAADFFSYAFLFWLPDGQKIDAKTMEQELLTYYRGLSKTVLASKKREVDVSKFTLSIKEMKEKSGKRASGETFTAWLGELKWVEPFATAEPQTLRFEIHVWVAGNHKHHCVFVCVSPQPEKAEIWTKLREIRDGTTVR